MSKDAPNKEKIWDTKSTVGTVLLVPHNHLVQKALVTAISPDAPLCGLARGQIFAFQRHPWQPCEVLKSGSFTTASVATQSPVEAQEPRIRILCHREEGSRFKTLV